MTRNCGILSPRSCLIVGWAFQPASTLLFRPLLTGEFPHRAPAQLPGLLPRQVCGVEQLPPVQRRRGCAPSSDTAPLKRLLKICVNRCRSGASCARSCAITGSRSAPVQPVVATTANRAADEVRTPREGAGSRPVATAEIGNLKKGGTYADHERRSCPH